MPRKARIDAPGALHHIIVRGIERRKIFLDDFDRDNFLKRLGNALSETATPCFAWALIPNHSESIRGARSENRPRGKVGVSGMTKPIFQ
jgi:REP element-mobilizing transposase RayT